MNNFQIPRDKFSNFFWDLVGYGRGLPKQTDLLLESLREQADYNTGSLSENDVFDLTALVYYFRPTSVCEIGTFIGRSTHAIASAMRGGIIWTCDNSNAIDLPQPENAAVQIKQFQKQNSMTMLTEAFKNKQRFDLFYIDGRISMADIDLMFECEAFTGSIFVLDDFEGVEKGVANASMLMNALANGPASTLIYPKPGHKTAVIVPFKMIRFVPQV